MDDSRMAATCDGIMARRADVARSPFFAMSVTGTQRTSDVALSMSVLGGLKRTAPHPRSKVC